MTDDEQVNNGNSLLALGGVVIILLFCIFGVSWLINNHRIDNQVMDICNSYGINVSSTTDVDWNKYDNGRISIQCYEDMIVGEYIYTDRCVKRNKWFECRRTEKQLVRIR